MDSQVQPALSPPPGMSSNFVDPVNMAPNLVACNVVLLTVSILIVGARVISRTILTDWRLGWDDYIMIVALIGTAVFGSFVITTTRYGLGKHMWDVPMSTYSPDYLWWIMAIFAACPASYYFVKISILLFYLRVFQLQPRLRYVIYMLMAYCTIYYWVAFSTIVGLCNARNETWDITATMNCFAYGKLTFAIGGMDLVADVLVLAFPVPMVLKLQISWPKRIYLLFVFLAGIAASIACVIRLAFAVHYRGTTDATMAQYHIVILFCIEHYFSLIAGCMPTLGPFFRYLHPSHWRRESQQNYRDDNGNFGTSHRYWPRKNVKSSPDATLMQSCGKASQISQVSQSMDKDDPFGSIGPHEIHEFQRSDSKADLQAIDKYPSSKVEDLENGIELRGTSS